MNKVILLSIFFPLTLLSLTGIMLISADAAELKPARELILFYDEKEIIASATKHSQTLQEAPAIATVITGDEIRNMGARDIIDVLRIVPGMSVTKGYFGLEDIEVRGIKTFSSEKVKLLIDGHSVNDNASGGALWGFDSLTVDNIKKIEIIRGPGSALYGSNAFSAVINVVTKDGKDIDGAVVTGSGGSFDTGKLNLQAGKKAGDFDIAASLDYLHTNGAHLKIDKDMLGNTGNTRDFEDKLDGSLKIAYKGLTFKSKYVARRKGAYLGLSYAVTENTQIDFQRYFGELGYNHSINEMVTVRAKVYIDQFDWDAYWELLPKGSAGFPDGMIGNPSLKERTLGSEFQLDNKLSEVNTVTLGIMGETREQYDVRHLANFDPTKLPVPTPLPGGTVENITSWGNWSQNKTRGIWAVYLQDVWDVTKDIGLTIGVRHDNYSDFGGTTNPRTAIVWRFLKSYDLKLLYGTAFRAPSFEELYNTNNPTVYGNPDLKPEKMTTYEASLGYSGDDGYHSRISYFYNIFKDQIRNPLIYPSIARFENHGGANVQGTEIEVRKDFNKMAYLYGNYTFQWPLDDASGKRLPDVPAHKGNIGANVDLTKYLNANTNLFLSGERPRADGDTRDAVPSYALVDLTLIAKNFYETLEIRGSAHNLLDQKYSDPAPPGTVPGNFPREGRSFMLEALYKF